jgi:hypothetical protein
MSKLGGEWDEAMETRFMYSADAKTGTVNRKAAQRVLAKAERWNKWQAQLPERDPARDPARAPALPTAYIAPKDAPSPTSILATSKSAPTFASPLPVAAVVDELVAGALERAVSGTTTAPASAAEEIAAEAAPVPETASETPPETAPAPETAATEAAPVPEKASETPPETAPAPETAAAEAAPVPETASETPPETAPAPATAAPAAFRERKKSKLLSLVEVGGLDVERFGSHLEKAFARENLSFVLRCRDYKALVEGGAPAADARRVAEEIRVLYVGEAAPDLVSLPPKDVAACLAALDGDAPLPADLFDALLHHTADELSRTNLGPFLVEERRRDLEAELLRTDAGATEVRNLLDGEDPAFRAHLDASFCGESAAFFDAVSAYAALFDAAAIDDAAVRDAAAAVARDFLRDDAPTPVNVGARPRKAALGAIDAGGPGALPAALFARLRADLLRMLARDALPRFRK